MVSEESSLKVAKVFLIYTARFFQMQYSPSSYISLCKIRSNLQFTHSGDFLFWAKESQQPVEEGATIPTPSQLQQYLKMSNWTGPCDDVTE